MNELVNVTYLIGAGASALALPIVDEFPYRIKGMIEWLKKDLNEIGLSQSLTNDLQKPAKQLIEDLNWLIDSAGDHASVDTYAKKLFLKKHKKELDRLKITLSIFFLYEQIVTDCDPRYDAFYASILSENITSFPPNIRILSWNYDNQFEKAFCSYSEDERIESSKSYLNVIEKYGFEEPKANRFSIFKLNGSTTLRSTSGIGQYSFIDSLSSHEPKDAVRQLVSSYMQLKDTANYFPTLSFAWEQYENTTRKVINYASSSIKGSEVLVIIGYSFPFFNREIDRQIFKNLPLVNTIYIQDKNPNDIKETLKSVMTTNQIINAEINFNTNLKKFLIPHEL